jgi:tellurite resistance protein
MQVKDLKPAGYNPRKISKEKLAALKKSLEEFGDLSGIVFNIRTETIIGGHQRTKNFDPSWPVVKEPHEDITGTVALGYIETPSGRMTYREVDWPEIKEKQANIAANKHGGEFDDELLAKLLNEIKLESPLMDFELVGFDDDEIHKLFMDNISEIDAPELKDGDRAPFQQMTFTLHDEQAEELNAAIKKAKNEGGLTSAVNQNSNGNALYFIAQRFNRG